MPKCERCLKSIIVMKEFSSATCPLCNTEFSSPYIPANTICEKCSKEKNICAKCERPLENK